MNLKSVRSIALTVTLAGMVAVPTMGWAMAPQANTQDTAAPTTTKDQQDALKNEEKANRERAKSAKAQRKALKAQEKAAKADKKAKDVAPAPQQ